MLSRCISTSKLLVKSVSPLQSRFLWGWINQQFNKRDEERLKKFGPDRVCAEWVLRNGGIVKLAGAKDYLRNYNLLPEEETSVQIVEIDASGSAIMHYGFNHLENCTAITKIILHKCDYLVDEALGMMKPVDNSLRYLQVSSCGNITDDGLKNISLTQLKNFVAFDLPAVRNKSETINFLKEHLGSNCKIEYDKEEV